MSFFKLELKDGHRLTESEDLNQTEMLYVFLFQRGEEPQSEILDRGFRGGLGRDTLPCLCTPPRSLIIQANCKGNLKQKNTSGGGGGMKGNLR